jgi:hypothetical protein
LTVAQGSAGYDGQFYYRLAIVPFSTAPTVAGVRFDYPVYRSQRILYPLVVNVLSGGDPCRVLWTMPAVNVAVLMLLVFFAARLIAMSGCPPLFAAIAGLWPGFLFSLARDLTEPLAVTLVLGALLATARRAPWWAALSLTLAGLTRETAMIAAVILLLYGAVLSVKEHRFSFFVVAGAVPIAAYYCWKRFLFSLWDLPVNWGTTTISGVPLAAFLGLLRDSYEASGHFGRVHGIELVLLIAYAVVVFTAMIRSSAHPIVKACCIAYFLFVAGLSRDVWVEDWAFLRVTAEFGVLGAVVVAHATPVWRRIGTSLMVAGFAALFYELLHFR